MAGRCDRIRKQPIGHVASLCEAGIRPFQVAVGDGEPTVATFVKEASVMKDADLTHVEPSAQPEMSTATVANLDPTQRSKAIFQLAFSGQGDLWADG